MAPCRAAASKAARRPRKRSSPLRLSGRGKERDADTGFDYFIPLRSMSRLRRVWCAVLRFGDWAVAVGGPAGGEKGRS
ncbi:MAG: hypothetical protein JNN12_00255 [Bacteroidetes Order II. Incertae sedis bacterium]|nr:hypothetical protein [Bacteroidetes Order II. bacterium]